MASTPNLFPTHITLLIVLLIEQREDFDISLSQMLHMIFKSLHTISHTCKGHKSLSAGSLERVLSDNDTQIPISIPRNHKGFEELRNILFRSLFETWESNVPNRAILVASVSQCGSLQYDSATSPLPTHHIHRLHLPDSLVYWVASLPVDGVLSAE